ncbi:hypothetical protein AB3331_02055 [Streptococcus sp. H49]|uniref:hypothetical protein n=1 Tax=Streptococcus huangxiaojuni TaxID=3237239 RepID=UPI0034A4413F
MATKEEWTSLFETVVGRKPSPQEFMKAKETGFDPTKIIEISGTKQDSNVQQPQKPSVGNAGVPSDKKDKEKIVLPIISLVISGLFLLLTLLTPWKLIFTSLALLAVIMAMVLLIVNWKKPKKRLTLIAFAVSILAFAVSLGVTAYTTFSSDWFKTVTKEPNRDKDTDKDDLDDDEEDSTDINDYIDKDYKFDWSESDFLSLNVYSVSSDKSGDKVKDILKTYGKASEARISDNNLYLTYKDSNNSKIVDLAFSRRDGIYTLAYAHAYGFTDNIKTDSNYKSTWKQSDFDDLKEASDSDLTAGSKWTDIQKKFGNPESAVESISNYGNGDGFEKTLDVTYSDYSASGDYLSYVSLDFKEEDGVYYLTHKYTSGA